MTEQRVRRTLLVLMTLSLVAPIVLTVLRITPPAAILVGLLTAFFLSRALSLTARDLAQQQQQELLAQSPNTSRTIYVELIDERGVLLPQEEQNRRLAEAYREAGPRDAVVPVKKRT